MYLRFAFAPWDTCIDQRTLSLRVHFQVYPHLVYFTRQLTCAPSYGHSLMDCVTILDESLLSRNKVSALAYMLRMMFCVAHQQLGRLCPNVTCRKTLLLCGGEIWHLLDEVAVNV